MGEQGGGGIRECLCRADYGWEAKEGKEGVDLSGTGMHQHPLPILLSFSPWTWANQMAGADLRRHTGAADSSPEIIHPPPVQIVVYAFFGCISPRGLVGIGLSVIWPFPDPT